MGCPPSGSQLDPDPRRHRNKTPAPPGCRYVRLSLLAAAVSREQLREGSAPSNHDFDSTPAGVCVTVKRGLWMAARGCEARSPRHAGPRSLVTASASRHDSPAAGGWGSCGTYAASIPSGFPPGLIGGIMGHAHRPPDKAMKPSPAAALSRSASTTAGFYFEDLPGRRRRPAVADGETTLLGKLRRLLDWN